MTDPQTATPARASDSFRSRGMHDLGPAEMRRFRRVESRFLEVTAAAGFEEIRTPTVEPLHLFTGAGALSPQLLDRVYSFLDWDGWSGERVVLRPDSTLPAVRWYEGQAGAGTLAPARLSYVQPVYRFEGDDATRELWQCGVELFGLGAPEGDTELLGTAARLLTALGLTNLRFELAHAGLMRLALGAAGLDEAGQLDAYERVLAGDSDAVAGLIAADADRASGLRMLLELRGSGDGYVSNLEAALTGSLPEAAGPLTELREGVRALNAEGVECELAPAIAGSFEYYTGVTFRAFAGDDECLRGGRYDRLAGAIGGRAAAAAGFAADMLQLAELAPAGAAQ